MTLKQRGLLYGLDIASIILGSIQIIITLMILKYGTNNDMKLLFSGLGIICLIFIYTSIKSIVNKEKL